MKQAKTISKLLSQIPTEKNDRSCVSTKNSDSLNENIVLHDENEWNEMPNIFHLLHDWVLVQNINDSIQTSGSDGEVAFESMVYLEHPFILRSWEQGAQKDLLFETDSLTKALRDEMVEESEELQDPDAIEEDIDFKSFSRKNRVVGEWKFSIVFHDIWQVPVLYFQANFLDGTKCARSDILRALNINEDQSKEKQFLENGFREAWDFISEEEHPITGMPSYFLHPCKTLERLNLIVNTLKNPVPGGAFSYDRNVASSEDLLIIWMTMILPTVRCKLDTKVIRFLQENSTKSISDIV